MSDNARRMRLNDLFAGDEFLSPTMKARTLHQRLNGDGGDSESGYSPCDVKRDMRTSGARSLSRNTPSLVPLAQVSEILQCGRAYAGRDAEKAAQWESVTRLNEEVLSHWLDGFRRR